MKKNIHFTFSGLAQSMNRYLIVFPLISCPKRTPLLRTSNAWRKWSECGSIFQLRKVYSFPFTSLIAHGYPNIEYWIYTNNHTIWICNKVWANLLHVWRIFFHLFSICLPLKVLHWLVEILLTFRYPSVFSKVFFFAWILVVYVYFDDGNGHLGSHHPFWCTFLAFTYATDGNCCDKKKNLVSFCMVKIKTEVRCMTWRENDKNHIHIRI